VAHRRVSVAESNDWDIDIRGFSHRLIKKHIIR
jgi:hypothetical protein